MKKFRLPAIETRPDANEHRNTAPGSAAPLRDQSRIEERLRHDILRASREFALQTLYLRVEISGTGIECAARNELRAVLDRFAVCVEPGIELPDDFQEFDGGYIINRRRTGVITHLRRIAGQRQHMANAQRRHSHQVALQTNDIAIAATQVQQRGHAKALRHFRRPNC